MGHCKTGATQADRRAGKAYLKAAGLIAALSLAECAAAPPDAPLLAQAETVSLAIAKRQILADRARIWKDPNSIQSASIGHPMPCSHEARLAASCVCIEANARNSYGGYTGIRRTIAVFPPSGGFDLLDGGIKGYQQYCQNLAPFPELEAGSRPKGR